MRARHFQWDSKQSDRAAWIGCEHGCVFGAKLVLSRAETETSYGGRYFSVWFGPVYLGAGVIW